MDRFDCIEIPVSRMEIPPGERALPQFDENHYLQSAELAWRNGDFERALRDYSRTLGLDPSREEAWLGQVRCLIDLDEMKEARLWVNKALEQLPRSAELMSAKAQVLSQMLEDKGAMDQSDKALSLKRYTWFLWYSRGYVLLRVSQRTAGYCFLKAAELNPQDWLVPLRVGMAYLDIRDAHSAFPYLRTALQAQPQNPLVLFQYGRCCAGMGWRAQAQMNYQAALARGTDLEKDIQRELMKTKQWGPWNWAKGLYYGLTVKEA